MGLIERYRRLTFWNKVAFWGAIASVLGLIAAMVPFVLPPPSAPTPEPLRAADFRLRFCVVGFGITSRTLVAAPKLIHNRGRLAGSGIEFDLRLTETIITGSSRGKGEPTLCYESEHFVLIGLEAINRAGISGEALKFTVPMALRELAGENTHFRAYFFVREKGPYTAYDRFEGGSVNVEVR